MRVVSGWAVGEGLGTAAVARCPAVGAAASGALAVAVRAAVVVVVGGGVRDCLSERRV